MYLLLEYLFEMVTHGQSSAVLLSKCYVDAGYQNHMPLVGETLFDGHQGFFLQSFPTLSMASCIVSGSLQPTVSGREIAKTPATTAWAPMRMNGSGSQVFLSPSRDRA